MSLNILLYPNPLLLRKSARIEVVTDAIRTLASEMVEVMYDAEGIGLAAPQVGHLVRLVTVDITGPERREGLKMLVNPVLTPIEGEGFIESEEACLSVSDYRSKVRRHAALLLEAQDLDGNPIREEARGMFAICLQHEVDHLDGKLFIDHISRLKRTMYDTRIRKRARQAATERPLI